jgi:fluoroquinolone resistance protein
VSLRGQNLAGVTFGGLRLRDADLLGADLSKTDLRSAGTLPAVTRWSG